MRSLLGRFHRPMSRGAMGDMLTMNSLGDGSTLSLDFTTMGGVLDPRLTFSRASTATFVNSSGYVEYAAQNLYYNTNFATITTGTGNPSLTGKGWGYVFNAGTAVFNTDGSVSMTAVANRVGLFRSAGFAGTGRRLIFSVDITSVGNTGLPPSQLVNEGTKTNESYYIDGVLWVSGNVVGPCTVSFVFTSNPSGNAITYFGLGMSSDSTSTGTVTFANPRWGLYGGVNQLAYYPNTSATNADYLTAAYHAPRFDYSPTNIGEPRGLLVEGQTANLLLSSDELLVARGYSEQDIIVPRTTGTSPSNGTAVGFYPTTSSGYHRVQSPFITGLSGAVTVSIWYKRLNSNYRAGINANAMLNVGAVFDLNGAGSVVTLGGSAANKAATITAYPNDWYRVTVTGTRATDNSVFFFMAGSTQTDFDGGTPFVGVANQGMLMWGAQLELGSGASSYIPTGASQVTRNGDSCVMTGTNFSSWFAGATEGVLFAQYEKPRSQSGNAAHDYSAVASKYNTGEGFVIYAGNSNFYPTNILWPTGGAIFAGGIATAIPSVTKQAGKWFGGNDVTMYSNGVVGTTAAGTGTVTPAMLSFGANSNTGTEATRDWLNACIRKVKFYPTALSDAAIQTLTTP